MVGFQQSVNVNPAPAIEGDWASANPRSSMLAGPGALIAGPSGVTVGRFAWADADGTVGVGGNGRLGFVHRDQISLITDYLGSSSMKVPPGVEITLHTDGDVWARFAAGATIGQKVYANYADGTATAGATATPAGSTSTAFTITAGTSSFTGSIANGQMTVTGAVTGTIYPGTIITGATTALPTGCRIDAQLNGTTGGDGVYLLSGDGGIVAASQIISGSYGLFTPAGTVTGKFGLGNTLTAAGSAPGTTITADSTNGAGLTGGGGAGTYVVSPTQAISAGTVTAATNYETRWIVASYAGAGELAKITTRG